jgi:hypothetical protein
VRGATGIIDPHRPALLIETAGALHAAAPEHIFRFRGARGYDGVLLFGGLLTSLRAFDPADAPRIKPGGWVAHPSI